MKNSARNSRAGNGCANFVGAWHFLFFLLANSHAHELPRFFGGGGRGLEGGGCGSANFIFMGVGIFPIVGARLRGSHPRQVIVRPVTLIFHVYWGFPKMFFFAGGACNF